MKKHCQICKKEFSKRKREGTRDWGTRRFCSLQCGYLGRENHKGIPRPAEVGVKISATKLANPNRFGENASGWKNARVLCVDCGERAGFKSKERCRGCNRNWQKEENHPRWVSDRALLKDESKERGGQFSREWSKNVKNRDNWTCRIADINCEGRLESHHILGWTKHPELRYEVNNGITLCHFHHPRKRNDEMRLSPYFQELIKI